MSKDTSSKSEITARSAIPREQRTVATKKVLHGKIYELWFLSIYIYILRCEKVEDDSLGLKSAQVVSHVGGHVE